jgi:hypothetical protein
MEDKYKTRVRKMEIGGKAEKYTKSNRENEKKKRIWR